MNPEKSNPKIAKVEEPSIVCESSKVKFKGIDRATFDFDEEVRKGYILYKTKTKIPTNISSWGFY